MIIVYKLKIAFAKTKILVIKALFNWEKVIIVDKIMQYLYKVIAISLVNRQVIKISGLPNIRIKAKF